ncbi:MAG: ArsR family transcriptional regulator [Prolixibacteraceae bacterium]|nr:ArsR family transcriptional regulator [Prolixibacteraceae bacterium]
MLSTLITSKTRKKLLIKFFINSNVNGYLRSLESEFGESTNSIRIELNRFEKAGLLLASRKGNKKYYKANTNHPSFKNLNDFLYKIIGIDNLVEKVIKKIEGIDSAYLTGSLAQGIDSHIFDLILVGNNLKKVKIHKYAEKFEKKDERKIRYLILSDSELTEYMNKSNTFKIWENTNSFN